MGERKPAMKPRQPMSRGQRLLLIAVVFAAAAVAFWLVFAQHPLVGGRG